MSELLDMIDAWRDRHGQPSDASIARAIGAAPQTISSWRKRGIRQLPSKELLHALADFLRVPQVEVIMAAARDAGYLEAAPPPGPPDGGDDGEETAPNTRAG